MHTHKTRTTTDWNDTYDAISHVLANTKWDASRLVPLHKDEMVLDQKQTKEMLRGVGKTPTKREYERALEVVQKYEDRQKDLAKLNRDLGFALKKFDKFRFDINESKKEVTFAGVTNNGEVKLEKSVARNGDKFEEVIGKLISVKKALGEDIKYIDKFVEKENTITIDMGGIHFGTMASSRG